MNFQFADATLISNAEITEQAFVDYINLFPQAPMDVVGESISGMLDKAIVAYTAMFYHFAALYERCLYDPNYPFR